MLSLKNSVRTFADAFLSLTRSSSLGRISVAFALLLALLISMSPAALTPAAAVVADNATIFGSSAPTSLVSHTDTSGVEVGTRFTARSNGTATAMRFWKGQGANGPHTGTLWSAQGAKLAGATFANESGSGWQTADFDRQIFLEAGATYVVSYYATKGRYAVTQNYAGSSVSPDLAIAAGPGVFAYGSQSVLPTDTYRGSVYWVDVVFEPTPLEPTPLAPAPSLELGAFPNADTTGPPAGTVLNASGGVTITTANAVLDGYRFSGDVVVRANNVTIRNSVIEGRIAYDSPYQGLRVEQTEIVGPGGGYQTKYPAIGYNSFTCDGCDIHGWGDGAHVSTNTTIKNSWIHDIAASGDSHNQAILSLGGNNIEILNNRLEAGPAENFTAALSLLNQGLSFTDTLVQGNLFDGGGYCVYAGGEENSNAARPSSNVRFVNNSFGKSVYAKCGYYGPVTSFDSSGAGNQWVNNRWVDGMPVGPAR